MDAGEMGRMPASGAGAVPVLSAVSTQTTTAPTTTAPTTTAPTSSAPDGRDSAIDTVRGLCVLSMVTGHLALGSWLSSLAHPVPFVDGATGFVLLSGLLVGMVQRSTMRGAGERAGYARLLRRTRVVYAGHLAIVVVALVAGAVDAARTDLPTPAGEGGWPLALLRAAALQVNPPLASVLSMYVLVMLAAVPLLGLLHRGRPVLAAGYALVVYAAGVARPAWSQLVQQEGARGGWSVAAWFGLFAVGALIGWHWRGERLQRLVRTRRALAAGLALAAAGVALATSLPTTGPSIRVLDKDAFGPGRLLLAVVVVFVLWRAAELALRARSTRSLLRPVATIGSRSLDCYLILAAVALLGPSVQPHDPAGPAGPALATATVGACWAWASVRSWWRERRARSW